MDFSATDLRYHFSAALWLHSAEAGWVFASLPPEIADDIEAIAPHQGGFGSVPVEVTIGATVWRTSLFPDSKAGSYVLPVKRPVRVREQLEVGDVAAVQVVLLAPA